MNAGKEKPKYMHLFQSHCMIFFWKIEFWGSSHTAYRLNQFNWRREMHNYLKRWVEWTLKFTWGYSFAISFFCRPGGILVCKLEGASFWEKAPGADFVPLYQRKWQICRGKTVMLFSESSLLREKVQYEFLKFSWGVGVYLSAQLHCITFVHWSYSNKTNPRMKMPSPLWRICVMYSVHMCGQLKLFLKMTHGFRP